MLTHGQANLGYPTLGEMIVASKNKDVLGISDRDSIIDYIQRALELATWKANWDSYLGDMDICSDECGRVTLPREVGTILACNVGGIPATFRNGWFQYHINGPGSYRNGAQGGLSANGVLGNCVGYTWEEGLVPTIQDLKEYSYVAAFVEDPIDGNGSLSLRVMGDTMDAGYNEKSVITIPAAGPSTLGVVVPLLNGYAATDPAATQFRRIVRVVKPVTRGYVKLIAFPGQQMAQGRTLGYYGPNETDPMYRRIRVNSPCQWVRIKYRRSEIRLVDDTDIVPLPCKHALINLIKAVRLSDTNNLKASEEYVEVAVGILLDRELIVSGPATFKMQVDPSFGIGCCDLR